MGKFTENLNLGKRVLPPWILVIRVHIGTLLAIGEGRPLALIG